MECLRGMAEDIKAMRVSVQTPLYCVTGGGAGITSTVDAALMRLGQPPSTKLLEIRCDRCGTNGVAGAIGLKCGQYRADGICGGKFRAYADGTNDEYVRQP